MKIKRITATIISVLMLGTIASAAVSENQIAFGDVNTDYSIGSIETKGTDGDNIITITVIPNNPLYGKTTGSSTLDLNDGCTLCLYSAEAFDGYKFVNWTVGKKVVSTVPKTALAFVEDTTLVANFEKAEEPDNIFEEPEDTDYALRCNTVAALGIKPTNLDTPYTLKTGGEFLAFADEETTAESLREKLPDGIIMAMTHEGKVFTGDGIILYKGEKSETTILFQASIVVSGDCSGDGKVDIADVVSARDIIVNHNNDTGFYWENTAKVFAMDVSNNNDSDIVDIIIMRSYIVNQNTKDLAKCIPDKSEAGTIRRLAIAKAELSKSINDIENYTFCDENYVESNKCFIVSCYRPKNGMETTDSGFGMIFNDDSIYSSNTKNIHELDSLEIPEKYTEEIEIRRAAYGFLKGNYPNKICRLKKYYLDVDQGKLIICVEAEIDGGETKWLELVNITGEKVEYDDRDYFCS